MKALSAPAGRRRWWAAGASAVVMAGLLPVVAHAATTPTPAADPAAQASKREELLNYDSRTQVNANPKHAIVTKKAAGVALTRIAAAEKPASSVHQLRASLGTQGIVDIDNATGTPRRVAKLDGYLTAASSAKPETIARNYLLAHADVFGLSVAAVNALRVLKSYQDIVGTSHVSFQQSVAGVAVFGNGIKVHIAKDGRIISVDGSPIASLPTESVSAKLTAESARAAAVRNVYGGSKATVVRRTTTAEKTTTFSDHGSAKLVMFQTAVGPTLAWQTISVDEGYIHVIDAVTGEVLYRQNTADKDNGLVWPNYPGALVGGRQQVVDLSTLGLPANSSRLDGAVAHVYADVNDDSSASSDEEISPAAIGNWQYPFTDFTAKAGGGCSALFPCSWDPATPFSWQQNRGQSAVQLYYFLGTWHDHLNAAPIGFTRAAGNFDAADGDAVQAHALAGADTAGGLPDARHIDNANMSTPPDGTPPTMRMYLYHDASIPNDPRIAANVSDEADVVYHEYTHGLSGRLVVDARGISTISSQQARSMGEGWSDWYASDYLADQELEPDTSADGEVQIGKYAAGGGQFRSEALDCSVGSTAAACPGTATAGSGGYTYGDFGKIYTGPEVHTDGEIWAQTLWDLRKAVGSLKAESLVTRAMELSPADPSFLDERNSILQADLVVDGGALQDTIWKVFAKRGMGYFAASVNGAETKPLEDFSMPPGPNTPRGTLTGTVTDPDAKAPVAGATVVLSGHASGFGDNYTAVTAADGTYTISGILAGKYPGVSTSLVGYDPILRTVTIDGRVTKLNWPLRRDWASVGGHASIEGSNGKFITGCSSGGLIDQSQSSGWSTNAVLAGAAGTTAVQPRFATVKLPIPISITELTINPSSTCGDGNSSAAGDFTVETSLDGKTWTARAKGHFTPKQQLVNTIPLTPVAGKVEYIRYTMLSTQVADQNGTCPGDFSGCQTIDSTELAVYGNPT